MRRPAALFSILLPALVVLAHPAAAEAEILPHATGGDPHIQSVTFDPQNVVALHVANGYATTIQFSSDERIETVTVGDTTGWLVQVNHRADHLVVKPLAAPSTTNLTVLTDQRTYNFTLYGGPLDDGVAPYVLSFAYPAAPAAATPVAPPPASRYKLHGDHALWPTAISDDGRNTTIVWAPETTLPAVYRGDEHGRRALVNQVMTGGAYVVEGVYGRLIFVRGRAEAHADRILPRNRP